MELYMGIILNMWLLCGISICSTELNWSNNLMCYLSADTTDKCEKCASMSCKDSKNILQYIELSSTNVPTFTRCLTMEECDMQKPGIAQYLLGEVPMCLHYSCPYGGKFTRILGTIQGQKGCIPESVNTSNPCYTGVKLQTSICLMSESQYFSAWNRSYPNHCLIWDYFRGECADNCTDKWKNYQYSDTGVYFKECSLEPINTFDGETIDQLYSYHNLQWDVNLLEYVHVRHSKSIYGCNNTSSFVVYLEDIDGQIVRGECISKSIFPDSICPGITMSASIFNSLTSSTITATSCTLSSSLAENYLGSVGENCLSAKYGIFGSCVYCKEGYQYLVFNRSAGYTSTANLYPYQCLNAPTIDQDWFCTRLNPTQFDNQNIYTTLHNYYGAAKYSCHRADYDFDLELGSADVVRVRVFNMNTWIKNYLTWVACPSGNQKEETKSYGTKSISITFCDITEEQVEIVVFNSSTCIPITTIYGIEKLSCAECKNKGDIPYFTQYLSSTKTILGPMAVKCISSCPVDDHYHYMGWTWNWGNVCYHMKCDLESTFTLIMAGESAESGGCIANKCFTCPAGKTVNYGNEISNEAVDQKAIGIDLCKMGSEDWQILQTDVHQESDSPLEQSYAPNLYHIVTLIFQLVLPLLPFL